MSFLFHMIKNGMGGFYVYFEVMFNKSNISSCKWRYKGPNNSTPHITQHKMTHGLCGLF